MPVPVPSTFRHTQHVDVAESLRCAAADRPAQADRHKKVVVQYLILLASLIAVVLLIAIAVYYTHGNSVSIKQISALVSQGVGRQDLQSYSDTTQEVFRSL